VVDVNSNAQNPIIGIRSFGENQQNVALKGMAYARGMQQNGIIACAKHFPGHGDTQTDSHHNLPVILHGYDRLEAVELYPFRQLIADSVMSIITGHLLMPYYDNKAASISDKIVTKLLRNDLGFQGLIFTDALNMRGITKSTLPGQLDLLALQAGNDVLLMSENVPEAIKRIKEALVAGQISQEVIDVHVRKILKAKYFAGLFRRPFIEMDNILADLNNEESQTLKQRIFENAATLVKNDGNMLPFVADSSQYVSVAIFYITQLPIRAMKPISIAYCP
jgi:beta-glucosidase-like glycosyl hydrolase